MPEQSSAPTFTRYTPLWHALGWQQDKHGLRYYWLDIAGHVRRFRASEMCGLGFLAEVYPDMEHWRRQFPTFGRGVDTPTALAHFVRACQAAGEYDPDSASNVREATPTE